MTRIAPVAVLPDPPAPPEPVGLIAAGGRLPILVARGLRAAGHAVCALGLTEQYEEELPALCDEFKQAAPLRVGSWGPTLRRLGCRYAVMVGRIDKARMMHNWASVVRNRPDWRTTVAWFRMRKDRRSHVILSLIADELAREGVFLIDSTAHIGEHMAEVGPMNRVKPSGRQQADIEFGWPLLQEMLRLDIGQAIAVRECDVVAVEAVEGTDRMIERTGRLCRASGWTVLKGARFGHDRRSDVPTVGPDTVTNLHAAGGRCLAIAAGEVIIVDKPDALALADKLGVAVYGVPPA